MRARRRIASLAVLALLGCVLAGSVAAAASLPEHCCPESKPAAGSAPLHPCASLVPAPCCGGPLAGQASPSLPLPPAAFAAPAATPVPVAAHACLRAVAARAAAGPTRAPTILRL